MALKIERCIAISDTSNSTYTLEIDFNEHIPAKLLNTLSGKSGAIDAVSATLGLSTVDHATGVATAIPGYPVQFSTAGAFVPTGGGAAISGISYANSPKESLIVTWDSSAPFSAGDWIKVDIKGWTTNGTELGRPVVENPFFYTRVHGDSPAGGGGAVHARGGHGPNGAARDLADIQSFSVLTQEMPVGGVQSTTRTGPPSLMGGASPLAVTADRAIREVLSWRSKGDDPKGFVGALNQAFDLKQVEGHTEWTWTPRSYTVQTDMGAVTGAQASIFTRAKVALDQSMPLLDGLYPLIPYVEQEDLATVQAVVRSQFTSLVNEFGVVGGPRVPRVDELFELLLGPGSPTNPEHIRKAGSLGLVRQRFGLERRFVTTVDDEQNLTNYMILVDYVIGLKQSWNHEKSFFLRGISSRQPFFGTQLVLISRALDVVAQGVQDAYFAMDSVFMADAERQTALLNFANLTVWVPDRDTNSLEPHTFAYDTSGLFVAELLDWVDRAATEELPALLQDAGKDGLESFKASTDRLRKFVHASMSPPQDARGLPPGYHTPRVKRALKLLADGLDEAYGLAFEVRSAEFPAELSPDEVKRIREALQLGA
ncbi:MAG: hypothetical protein JO340_16495 [Acidobacteriaceae bacterium]|nr:hypothetical protein [Acidobacteriaceae bacterium]